MFENDGIDTLQSPDVVQEKRIIFWNLVGHLPYIKFRLISQSLKKDCPDYSGKSLGSLHAIKTASPTKTSLHDYSIPLSVT